MKHVAAHEILDRIIQLLRANAFQDMPRLHDSPFVLTFHGARDGYDFHVGSERLDLVPVKLYIDRCATPDADRGGLQTLGHDHSLFARRAREIRGATRQPRLKSYGRTTGLNGHKGPFANH